MGYKTILEVIQMTGLKYNTVVEWAKEGILPARIIPHGKKSKYFFVEKEIIEWIEKHKVQPV